MTIIKCPVVSLYVGLFGHDTIYLARLIVRYPHHQSWTECRRHTHCRIFESSRTLRISEGVLHNYYVDQYRNSNNVDASTVVISNY